MANTIYVALLRPDGGSGTLVYKTADFDGVLTGQEKALTSNFQAIAVFVKREQGANTFWDYYSGNSLYTLRESATGIDIYAHDSGGQGSTRLRHFANDGSAAGLRTVDNKIAAAVVGGGATWDVYEDGQGSLYEQKLQDVFSYMISNHGYPAPTP